MAAYRRVYDSCHLKAEWLTVKNRDQLRNPTVDNRVWATFTFLLFRIPVRIIRVKVTVSVVTLSCRGHVDKSATRLSLSPHSEHRTGCQH